MLPQNILLYPQCWNWVQVALKPTYKWWYKLRASRHSMTFTMNSLKQIVAYDFNSSKENSTLRDIKFILYVHDK